MVPCSCVAVPSSVRSGNRGTLGAGKESSAMTAAPAISATYARPTRGPYFCVSSCLEIASLDPA